MDTQRRHRLGVLSFNRHTAPGGGEHTSLFTSRRGKPRLQVYFTGWVLDDTSQSPDRTPVRLMPRRVLQTTKHMDLGSFGHAEGGIAWCKKVLKRKKKGAGKLSIKICLELDILPMCLFSISFEKFQRETYFC